MFNNREQILLKVTQEYKAKFQLVCSGDHGSISYRNREEHFILLYKQITYSARISNFKSVCFAKMYYVFNILPAILGDHQF